MTQRIRIATRESQLALWQANLVKNLLQQQDSHIEVEIVGVTTRADRDKKTALKKLGGKSLFVKELQTTLLEKRADIAVHCAKDLSVYPHPKLQLACVLARADARDVLISEHYHSLEELPANARIGTGSPRRRCLLRAKRPEFTMEAIRGNVGTRLEKLRAGKYDAIVLAAAGLERLGLQDQITQYLEPNWFTPAIGQGALVVECRNQDIELQSLLNKLNDEKTAACVAAERAVNQVLGGDCMTAIAAYATLSEQELTLHATLGDELSGQQIRAQANGPAQNAVIIGENVAAQLQAAGASQFLTGN